MRSKTYGAPERRTDRLILSSVAAALALYAAFSCTFFAFGCSDLKSDVVRLHISANSDSEADQKIKLAVRDALLEMNMLLPGEGVNTENAAEYFENSKDALLARTLEVLESGGFDYGAELKLCREYFPTREYEGLVFPAGEYTSVRVVLGKGEGHNWWCVMFPPLCVGASGEFKTDKTVLDETVSPGARTVVSSGGRYKIRFKIVEWIEKLTESK